jgi:hypothetical protein
VKPPDRKERELAAYYRDRVASDSFDERDVAALLITLRLVVQQNRILFELGSFLAHRRRTKGDFHRFFHSGVLASKAPGGLQLGMNARPIYETSDILVSINRALDALDLGPLTSDMADGLLFCIISLLQDVTFEDATSTTELGRLFLAFNKEEIFSIAAVRVGEREEQLVPVLRVRNRWLPWQVAEGDTAEGTPFLAVPNEWLTVLRRANGLVAVPHETTAA